MLTFTSRRGLPRISLTITRTRAAQGRAAILDNLESRLVLDGAIDASFGVRGTSIVERVVPANDAATAMVTLASGQLLVSHHVASPVPGGIATARLARYGANGVPDTTFGVGGSTTLGATGSAGVSQLLTFGANAFLAFSDGNHPVSAFGADGRLLPQSQFQRVPRTDFAGTPRQIAVTNALAGGPHVYVLTDFALYRLGPDGQLDRTFADFGSLSRTLDDVRRFTFNSLAVDSAGNAIVGGAESTIADSSLRAAVLRVSAGTGQPDPAFGANGIQRVTNVSTHPSVVLGIAIDSTGRMALHGTYTPDWTRNFVSRLTPTGAIDSSFGTSNGLASLGVNGAAEISNLRIDSSNRLHFFADNAVGGFRTVHRFTAAGQPDATFDVDGAQTLPQIAGMSLSARRFELDAQANPVILSEKSGSNPDGATESALTRIRATNGAADATFGTNGVTRTNFSSSATSHAVQSIRQADGKIVTLGRSSVDVSGDRTTWQVARWNANGTRDTTFGQSGIAQLTWGAFAQVPSAIAVDGTGRIVVAGATYGPHVQPDTIVSRLLSNGTFDPAFGTGGTVRFTTTGVEGASTVAVLPGDALLLGGWAQIEAVGSRFAFWKVSSSGVPDSAFGSNGVAQFPAPVGSATSVYDLHLSPGGKVLATGQENIWSSQRVNARIAMRINASTGALDNTYGTNGFARLAALDAGFPRDPLRESAVDADGRLLIATRVAVGYDIGGERNLSITRLTPEGQVDPTFGDAATPGSAFLQLDRRTDRFTSMALDPLGRVVLGATVSPDGSSMTEKVAIRLHADGSPDRTFGDPTTGRAVIDVSRGRDSTASVIPLPAGGLFVAGDANPGDATALPNLATTRLSNSIGDGVAPRIVATTYAFDAPAPRVSISFSENVLASLSPSDVRIVDLATGTALPTSLISVTPSGSLDAAVTFNSATGQLPDGAYRLAIAAGALHDAAGTPTVVGTMLDFFVLAGDANRDKRVNFDDLLILASNYNSTGKTFSQGNFNYDASGNVNFDDLLILASRYNVALPATVAPPPMPGFLGGDGDDDGNSDSDDVLT